MRTFCFVLLALSPLAASAVPMTINFELWNHSIGDHEPVHDPRGVFTEAIASGQDFYGTLEILELPEPRVAGEPRHYDESRIELLVDFGTFSLRSRDETARLTYYEIAPLDGFDAFGFEIALEPALGYDELYLSIFAEISADGSGIEDTDFSTRQMQWRLWAPGRNGDNLLLIPGREGRIITVVPTPHSLALFATGFILLGVRTARRRHSHPGS